MGSTNPEKEGLFARRWEWLKALPMSNLKANVFECCSNTIKLGRDDPRRVTHSLKVGLALTLVSLLYYYQPLYKSFSVTAMWAVMTVVVVFEFSVGATLGKGLNRVLATLLAGALGVGAHHLANLCGHTGEPIILGLFVFLQAATSTFVRFFPRIKARYDYGMLIFILTFSLVTLSGFRDDEILELAKKRLWTIALGGCICAFISILVCPVWAGEDLHNLIALNLEKLGNFLEVFGDVYLKTSEGGDYKDNEKLLQDYKSVLNSRSNEESLANFARWEPGHGKFQFRHPWKQYLEIGNLNRQCACLIEALNVHLNSDHIQASPDILSMIQEVCPEMSLECGRALKELGTCVRTMTRPSLVDTNICISKGANKDVIKSILQSSLSWPEYQVHLLKLMPATTVASLLIDVVDCVEKIACEVNELASMAHFKATTSTVTPSPAKISQTSPCDDDPVEALSKSDNSQDHVVVIIKETTIALEENEKHIEQVSSTSGRQQNHA